MTQAPFGRIWAVSVALGVFLSGKASAQVSSDSAAIVEQQVEIAAAAYVGAVLRSGHGPGFRGVPDVAFDKRIGTPEDEATTGKPMRSLGHATRLAGVFGAPLTDGNGAVTCANGTSERTASRPCHLTQSTRGILRMSSPLVSNDSARVTVVMLRPGGGRLPIYRTTWDLRLARVGGEWKVVAQPYSTRVT